MSEETTATENINTPSTPGDIEVGQVSRRRTAALDVPRHQPKISYDESTVKLDQSSCKLVQIAPQLKVTDRHCRMFTRMLTHRSQLWTEMVVDSTIIHTTDLERFLGHDPREQPLTLQLGGCSPEKIGQAARRALDHGGFQELNLNAGCPSNRVVEKGAFGACLMREPTLVSEICSAMLSAIDQTKNDSPVAVSIKTRIGVDSHVGGTWLEDVIQKMGATGVREFCMHARPAILGMSTTPAQNRSIPPLDHEVVFDLEKKYGAMGYRFSVNGGIKSVDEILELLHRPSYHDDSRSALAGVMIGRGATDDPCMLANVDSAVFGEKSNPATALSRATVLEGYLSYLDDFWRLTEDKPRPSTSFIYVKPVVGLFYCTSASKLFRQSVDRESKAPKSASGRSPIDILQKVFTNLEANCAEVLHAPIVAQL